MPKSKPKPKNTDTIILGQCLRELRLKIGESSLERFAGKNGISRVLYSNWENGRGNITYRSLIKVSRALKVSMKDLFSQGID